MSQLEWVSLYYLYDCYIEHGLISIIDGDKKTIKNETAATASQK